MTPATKAWLHGLGAAVVTGGSNAIAVAIVDPATFNVQTGALKLLTVAAVSGVLSAALYLKQSPLPPDTETSTVSLSPDVSKNPASTGEPK